MRKPIYVRALSSEEREAVEAGLHCSDAFTLRRCQIVLASSRGKRASQIAQDLSCDGDTVTKAINAFNQRELEALRQRSHAVHTPQAVFDAEAAERLKASVQRLVSLPKLRGLWCSRARSCSAWVASKPRSMVSGTVDPGVKHSRPARLKALIASRAVSVSQPNSAAIREARLPLALASRIWQRRNTKALGERSPAPKALYSSSVNCRT
jgi:hypothetical protein